MITLDFAPAMAKGEQSLNHWIFLCPTLSSHRCNSLNFINDLFSRFSRKLNEHNSSSSSRTTIDSKKYINHFILMFLLGGTLALNELHIDSGEQRQLFKLLIEGVSESSVPYIVGFAEFLTNTIPIISSSFELLFDKYCKIPITTRSVDVVPIGHRHNIINSNINSVTPNTGSSNLQSISLSTDISNNDELRESLVDTTLSILKMLLLCFIILLSLSKVNTPYSTQS